MAVDNEVKKIRNEKKKFSNDKPAIGNDELSLILRLSLKAGVTVNDKGHVERCFLVVFAFKRIYLVISQKIS